MKLLLFRCVPTETFLEARRFKRPHIGRYQSGRESSLLQVCGTSARPPLVVQAILKNVFGKIAGKCEVVT